VSEENVERMMEAIEAFNRGDLEAMFQGYDPEVNFEHRLADLQGTFVGIDAVKGWFAPISSTTATGEKPSRLPGFRNSRFG
jgi:hypothetical protein